MKHNSSSVSPSKHAKAGVARGGAQHKNKQNGGVVTTSLAKNNQAMMMIGGSNAVSAWQAEFNST